MTASKYRKKPVVIEAMQSGTNHQHAGAVMTWIKAHGGDAQQRPLQGHDVHDVPAVPRVVTYEPAEVSPKFVDAVFVVKDGERISGPWPGIDGFDYASKVAGSVTGSRVETVRFVEAS